MAELDPNSDVRSWIGKVSFTKIPAAFDSLASPWRVSDQVENSETINRILAQSLVVQSSTIPLSDHPNLPHCIYSNGCIIIGELMRYYLSWLNIDAKVHCGSIKKGPGRYMIHVFLEVQGEILDNTYIHYPPGGASAQARLEFYLSVLGPKLKTLENYRRTPPSNPYTDSDKIMMTSCKSDLNMKKNITSTMKIKQLGAPTVVYDKLMRHFLKMELGVDVPPVTEVIANVCWGCGEEKENLKTCNDCKAAKYCTKECQLEDWKTGCHGLDHKERKKYLRC